MQNPSFELPYVQESGTVQVAEGWHAWWSEGDPPIGGGSNGPCVKPEFKPLPRSLDPYRVVDGETAQCWFIRWKVMDGGLYQVVPAVAGRAYSFDLSAQAWCDKDNDPYVSRGEMYLSLGIDPNGQTNPFGSVVWGDWQWVGPVHKRYASPTVEAKGDVTLFIRAWNKWALSHNDIYVDDATFHGETGPTPGVVDYEMIRQIVREELVLREPAKWPR